MDVMLDLETLGTGSKAVILSIGAIEFDVRNSKLGRQFYVNVDPQSCVDAGMTIDVATVMWWLGQSEQARKDLTAGTKYKLADCLDAFFKWYPKGAQLWGNGATFDNVILSNAYLAVKKDKPWLYSADRCYRTLKAIHSDVSMNAFEGTAHNALADAKHQALHALKIYKEKGLI